MASSVTLKRPQRDPRSAFPQRLVIVTGNKGGSGKSTFARGLLDLYRHQQIGCVAYDSDTQNSQLFRYYGKVAAVSRIDLAQRGSADVLLEDMEQPQRPVILLDLPAGGSKTFQQYEQDIQLIDLAAESNFRLTLVSVISRVKDSVNALRQLMEYCGDRADYVVVKNLYFGGADRFQRFDQSKTKAQFLDLGGIEILMPELFDVTYDLVDAQDLTFRGAMAEDSNLNRAHRSRLNQWLKQIDLEVRKAHSYLGLPQ